MSSPSGSTGKGISIDQLREQVRKRLNAELEGGSSTASHEYTQFRQDLLPEKHSFYEKAAVIAGTLFPIGAGKAEASIQKQIDVAHLNITPKDALSLSIFGPFLVFVISMALTVVLPFALTGNISLYYVLFSLVLATLVYVPLQNMPKYLATGRRQRASNQMVLAIFYIVTYMRHTSNLELAIQFAADHIGPPLSYDLKKILWDIETEHYKTISESIEAYLMQWQDTNREFVESMHLVQASLFETSNDRRINSLDKALDVMLEETYEKMLHYAQNLKSPITMLHMLGIILPILGLVILPLAVSFFNTDWKTIFSFYNVLLPFLVFYLGKRILLTRPTGYGQMDIAEMQPDLPELQKGRYAKAEAIIITLLLVFLGITPIIIHFINPAFDVKMGNYSLLDYTMSKGEEKGPFGLGAGLISLFITLGAGIGAAWYFRRKSKHVIKIRNRTRRLEDEFGSSLFQLGNRIGDGIPAEIAFGKVATMMQGTKAGDFFSMVANNIQKLGMGVEEAIFHPVHGALTQFPSQLIESSMKVLLESSKKGPIEASKALMSMSNYIKEMHRVDERLRDLLSDVLGSMKSQINFLMPTIAGIVIGITSMITSVLGAIQSQAAMLEEGAVNIPVQFFGLGIPTYHFQIIVGLYVVEITWILAYLISGIENGSDKLSEAYLKGKALYVSTILYCAIAFTVILVFNIIAGQIITVVPA